jgi:acyl-coenzyme A thioesterase PaaI-like protein
MQKPHPVPKKVGSTPSDADVLASELRAIAAALAEHDLAQANLSEATGLARKLRQTLEGPRRPRWYDADGDALSLSPESRTAYLDQSPIRGRLNPVAPPLSIRVVPGPDGDKRIEGLARLGIAYEGPPHGVHGGWVAALFDDVLGATQGLSGGGAVTAKLIVRYRAVTPIDEDLRFEGWIDRETQRRIVARSRCYAGDTLTADAEGIFVRVDFNELQALMSDRRKSRG